MPTRILWGSKPQYSLQGKFLVSVDLMCRFKTFLLFSLAHVPLLDNHVLELVRWTETEMLSATAIVDMLVEDVNNVHLVSSETHCQLVDAIQA